MLHVARSMQHDMQHAAVACCMLHASAAQSMWLAIPLALVNLSIAIGILAFKEQIETMATQHQADLNLKPDEVR
jgi:hypothetical protein